MLFNSLEFLLFLPVVVALYFATPHRARWAVLLAASYVFYGWWRVEYLSLIVFSTLVDYVAALRMGQHETRVGRRPWLALSLVSNLGLLFAFKYLGFFVETAAALSSFVGVDGRLNVPALLLPVGISFYTFQTLAYSIDVYRGRQEPERHFGIFALYVAFWPQLVAGPIERSQNLLPQFRERHRFNYERAVSGLRLVLWGFVLKVVLADRLAITVNEVYNHAAVYGSWPVVLATYFFAFQIYGDFAGYSLIAIGSARVMGYDLMQNFRTPYLSRSIGEFWRRWHISLSTWFRDYLYIPLGGNRVSRSRWYLNLFIVFVVSGVWHGAAWTFVVWGALHGLYLLYEAATSDWRERVWARVSDRYDLWQSRTAGTRAGGLRLDLDAASVRSFVAWAVTFHLVLLAWVFFRAGSLHDAGLLLSNAVQSSGGLGPLIRSVGAYDLVVGGLVILTVFAVDAMTGDGDVDRWLRTRSTAFRWAAYVVIVLTLALFGVYDNRDFIYFQF